MNTAPDPNGPQKRPFTALRLVPAVILLAVIALLWTNQSNKETLLQELASENSRLQQELAAARTEIADLSSGDPSAATKERLQTSRTDRTALPDSEEVETLFLQEPTVKQTDEGLTVRLAFNPGSGIELPEDLTLVVRVPDAGTARIVSLSPASESGDSRLGSIVNASGSLAIIQGSPSDMGSLSFDLTVSGSGKATVRGSEGIIDFELDISPEGCAVRKL